MDSSGATRPYGQAGEDIRAYGWLPDSKQFVYGEEDLHHTYLGKIGESPIEISVAFPSVVRWVNAEYFLAIEDGDLILGDLKGDSMLIDSDVKGFDFTQ